MRPRLLRAHVLTGNGGTYDGFHSYMYDAEGRLYEVVDQTICYTYDGDGDRVATTNCNVVNGGSGNTTGIIAEFLDDPDHRLVSQINISTEKLTRANIYAGGEFLAEDAPDAAETGTPVATQMRVTDQVGLLRGRWDYAGKQNGGCTSFPYGDGFSCTNPSTAVFTGKDRDNESALYTLFSERAVHVWLRRAAKRGSLCGFPRYWLLRMKARQ